MNKNKDSISDGQNAIYLEQLYQQYQEAPESLSEQWRQYFSQLDQDQSGTQVLKQPNGRQLPKLDGRSHQVKVSQLISAYRYLGHLQADTNPLGSYAYKVMVPELMLEYHELENTNPKAVFDPGSFNLQGEPTLENIIAAMQKTYLSSIGFEYMHMMDVQEKRWIQSRIEPMQARETLDTTLGMELNTASRPLKV